MYVVRAGFSTTSVPQGQLERSRCWLSAADERETRLGHVELFTHPAHDGLDHRLVYVPGIPFFCRYDVLIVRYAGSSVYHSSGDRTQETIDINRP